MKVRECPFCGSIKTKLGMSSVGKGYWRICEDCRSEGPIGMDDSQALGLWNMRINPWKPITDDIKDSIQVVDIWVNGNRVSKCKWNKKAGCWRSYAGRYYMGATHYIPDPPPPEVEK